MEALAGFFFGYLFGTKHGRKGLVNFLDAWEEIQHSPEVKAMRSMAMASARQTLAATGKSSARSAAVGATSAAGAGAKALMRWAAREPAA